MKNFLLLFLIGTTFTISAQKIGKKIPLNYLNGGLITSKERAIIDYERSIRSNYSSSEAEKIEGWVNISGLQAEVKNPDLRVPNISIVLYPDSTVKQLSSVNSGVPATLSTSNLSGYGQIINFNNDALSASDVFQFRTNKDTVNIDRMRLSYYYLRSKTMIASKSDSIFVSYGVVPRNFRAPWVGRLIQGSPPSVKNPERVINLLPKTSGNSAHGFQKVFTGTGVTGLKTDTITLASGTHNSTINVNKKLIKDSLFIYYVTYKPGEFAPVNDTIFDWGNQNRAKYSSFRVRVYTENSADEDTRYFDDINLTEVGLVSPVSYTTNLFQFSSTRYGVAPNNVAINWMGFDNAYGVSTDFYISGNSTLSTNEQLAPKFAMAPNPANNTLKINFKEVGQKSIEIIDMVGRVINQYAANNANSFSTNDIASLPNGIYFLKITNDLGISATKKLIVSH